jgi:Protein of unknown function (DUF1549)/Protein of unknown function (DUF1553)
MKLRRGTPWFAAVMLGVMMPAIGVAADDPAPVANSMVVHPTSVELRHQRHPLLLQVLGASADGYTVDLQSQAKFASADAKVVTVDERGWIRPVGNGQTQITVTVAGQTKSVAVKVQVPATEPAYSFRHEVMPALSKAGCNMGACHGYSLGKNGFKLSLRGADPDQDYFSITREYNSRRLSFQSPEHSLLVAKPRGDAPHEGGVRFARTGIVNDILVHWIQQGAPGDLEDKAKVVSVRLIPDKLVLRPGQKHRLQLLAEYTDGTIRDVTRLGVLSANNNQYADIDDDALVTASDTGETAIVARFERRFAATSVMVVKPDATFKPTPVPQDHFIDKHVVEKLNRLKITPSPLAGDEEFLRRVYIDLIGVQPKPDEIRAFLADKDPKKRDKTIDGLLQRAEFVDQWSLKWGDLLQNSRSSVSAQSVFQFREFIRSSVASNMPMDEFARKIVTARGGILDDPASVYFAISKDTNDTLERATQVFCGVRMLCARCHSHPLENWTQADYYGLASFFTQVAARPDVRFPGSQNTRLIQINPTAAVAVNPRTGKAQPARFLGGIEPKLDTGADRRAAYARWLTSPENPFFARGLVNRYWSYFFHRGIIEPVDDIRSTNPPINPALLDALTKDFIDHKFDVRHLLRRIVTSATYQRTSIPTASNKFDEQNFSHSIPRRIPAEALLDSLIQATGVPENFGGAPAGFRAGQLPDANVVSDFLKLFGKSQRMEACECERDNGSNMLQALHFLNGKAIDNRVKNPGARPALLLRQKMTDQQLVAELFLWSLARNPSMAELALGMEHMKSYGAERRTEAVQDLFWALLNSRDFQLLH